MIIINNCILYPDYLGYFCPNCGRHNMFIGRTSTCVKCKNKITNGEVLQRVAMKRLLYYSKGIWDVRDKNTKNQSK